MVTNDSCGSIYCKASVFQLEEQFFTRIQKDYILTGLSHTCYSFFTTDSNGFSDVYFANQLRINYQK